MTDQELIARYLNGDESAFALLYGRHRQSMYAGLARILQGRTDILDDIFQKTWIKIIAKLDSYQDRDAFGAWAMTIARHQAYDHFRSEKRRQEEPFEDLRESGASLPPTAIELHELEQAVETALATLPPSQQEVFRYRQAGLPFKKIAVLQKTNINTALCRMQYGLQKMRRSLQGWHS